MITAILALLLAAMAALHLIFFEKEVAFFLEVANRELGPSDEHEPTIRKLLMGIAWYTALGGLLLGFLVGAAA